MLFLVQDDDSGYGQLESAVIRAGSANEAGRLFRAEAMRVWPGEDSTGRLHITSLPADGDIGIVHTHVPT